MENTSRVCKQSNYSDAAHFVKPVLMPLRTEVYLTGRCLYHPCDRTGESVKSAGRTDLWEFSRVTRWGCRWSPAIKQWLQWRADSWKLTQVSSLRSNTAEVNGESLAAPTLVHTVDKRSTLNPSPGGFIVRLAWRGSEREYASKGLKGFWVAT